MTEGIVPDPERFRSLHALGFSVIPLLPRGKNPILEWKGYQDRRAADEEIEAWSRDPRGLNVGVVTGPVSGNLAVVDIDNAEARSELERRFGPLPTTPVVKTGRGWHVYFVDPDGALRNFTGKLPGVDLRAIGGQVVGPGSVHSSGVLYHWEPGRSPHDVPIAAIPDWLKDLASKTAVVPEALPAPMPAAHPSRPYAYAEKALGYEANRLRAAQRGYRNNTLNASAFAMGGLIGAGALDRDVVERTLFEACEANRLLDDDGERSVRTTLRSGIEAGMAQPRNLSTIVPPTTFHSPTNGRSDGVADAGAAIASPLFAYTLEEIMLKPYPPRELILDPWLRVRDLVMIYAMRGTGKTWVSLGIALAVSSGKPFLKWTCPKPRRVLLVDGEMPIETLQERSALLCRGGGYDPQGRLRIIAALLQEGSYPNIATPEGQEAIEAHIQDEELVILDNLSCLAGSAVENEAESWEPIQGWLLGLRKRGVAVIFIHHAGKSNDQRGTSKREDVLDTTIQLKRPRDYDPKEGARFEVHFTKARGLVGPSLDPFEARIEADEEHGARCASHDLGDLQTERIIELSESGMSQRAIAKEVGLDAANVNRRLKAAREDGRLSKRGDGK